MAAFAKIFIDGTDESSRFDLVSIRASESLGRIYTFHVVVLSKMLDLAPNTVLGKQFGVELSLQDGVVRCFNGVIFRMGRGPQQGHRHEYWFELRPDIALLGQRSDARIFQNKTVLDVIGAVVAHIPSLDWHFNGSSLEHLPWEYCVQYQETDLAFAMRLLEQEGIYFYFEHREQGRTRMVLLDDNSMSYQKSQPLLKLSFDPNTRSTLRSQDYLEAWGRTNSFASGKAELSDFDFVKPMQVQEARRLMPSGHAWDDLDLFFYPGEFDSPKEGETYAELRMQALHNEYTLCEGSTTSPSVAIGTIIHVKDHPVANLNGDFLVTTTSYSVRNRSPDAGSGEGTEIRCDFTAIPADVQFRPKRITPKSTILGPQTAFVVGPEKNEIYTDEYGRIRVMFHWDRYGKPNEDTSCWIRVAQSWANQGFGFWALPRVGSEVVVQFLDGDPDRPIVTGSVYNGQNRIPYPQPDNKTRSGIRTHSSPDGGMEDYNELRFEDKKGQEEVFLQAQKDMNTRVKADATCTVGGHDKLSVEASQTIKVADDRSVTVGKNQTTSIKGDCHVGIDGNQYRIVEGKRVSKVGADSMHVQGDVTCRADGMVGISTGQSYALQSQLGIALSAQTTVDIQSGLTVAIGAASGLTISCGSSFISLTPAGIFIQGPLITMNTGGASIAPLRANPATPQALQKALQSGKIVIPPSPPIKPATMQPKAGSLANAARSGAAFARAG